VHREPSPVTVGAERSSESDLIELQLARITASAAVPLETAPGDRFLDAADRWRRLNKVQKGKKPPPRVEDAVVPSTPIDAAILEEEHHAQYGRPWFLGRYVFDFLVESGLQPHHRLLDIGCGALRVGIHAIRYLDAGNYFGVDAHLKSLEAAVTYEIPLHGLEEKRPRILWSRFFDFSYFATTFDFVLDFSTSARIPEELAETLFTNLASVVTRDTRVFSAPRPQVSRATLEQWGFKRVGRHTQQCPLLEGHSFKARITWHELAPA
jgi:SAM-dependent methyltransferase